MINNCRRCGQHIGEDNMYVHISSDPWFCVKCPSCGHEGPGLPRISKEEAIRLWNENSYSKRNDLFNREFKNDFERHKKDWIQATAFMSSITDKSINWSYQLIIGMGPRVVPLILRELEHALEQDHAPEHWFWALGAITGGNPVPPKYAGDMKMMAKFWLDFGVKEGYRSL